MSSNRKMLQLILKKKGLDPDLAVDGAEAVRAVQRNPNIYRIIFMDNMMPNMVLLICNILLMYVIMTSLCIV